MKSFLFLASIVGFIVYQAEKRPADGRELQNRKTEPTERMKKENTNSPVNTVLYRRPAPYSFNLTRNIIN